MCLKVKHAQMLKKKSHGERRTDDEQYGFKIRNVKPTQRKHRLL